MNRRFRCFPHYPSKRGHFDIQRLDYIETDPANYQWIDTGVVLGVDSVVTGTFEWVDWAKVGNNSWGAFFGAHDEDGGGTYMVPCVMNYTRSVCFSTTGHLGYMSSVSSNQRVKVVTDSSSMTVTPYGAGSTVVQVASGTPHSISRCMVFSANRAATPGGLDPAFPCGRQRCYGITIAESGVVVLDAFPASVNGVVCLYDRISEKPLLNGGDGAFVAGPQFEELTSLRHNLETDRQRFGF